MRNLGTKQTHFKIFALGHLSSPFIIITFSESMSCHILPTKSGTTDACLVKRTRLQLCATRICTFLDFDGPKSFTRFRGFRRIDIGSSFRTFPIAHSQT
jgi:hypothetical protein